MGTVQQLAEKMKEGLQAVPPKLRQTVLNQRALAVGAMLESQTPHTSELASGLPVPTERQGIREPWWRRLVTNPLLESAAMREPFARTVLEEAARNGQTVMVSLDQTELGDRFAVLMLAVPVGDRSLPLTGPVAVGAANLGFAGPPVRLERVRAWLPPGAAVVLVDDRFYPSAELFAWVQRYGWQYRRRLKGHLTRETDVGNATPGELAQGVRERYLPTVRRLTRGVPTHLGRLSEAGHEAPWILARDCQPTQAAVRDDGARWAIEPRCSDGQRRGFQRADTQLRAPERLDRLILIMTLAMYWCVRVGRHDALYNPTPVEKKPRPRPILIIGA